MKGKDYKKPTIYNIQFPKRYYYKYLKYMKMVEKNNFITTYFEDFSVCKPRAHNLRRYILRAGKQSEMENRIDNHVITYILKTNYAYGAL